MSPHTPKPLSEHRSRQVLEPYKIPLVKSMLVSSIDEAIEAAEEIGYPVVLKATGDKLIHKTEKSLVKLGLSDKEELRRAFEQITGAVSESDLDGILIQPFIKSSRELIVGMKRDEHFGPCVLFGLGGIFAQAMEDVVFRVAPLQTSDAMEMLEEIRGSAILNELRGEPAAERQELADLLVAIGKLGLENDDIEEIDLNPVLLHGAHPLAVDALVVTR